MLKFKNVRHVLGSLISLKVFNQFKIEVFIANFVFWGDLHKTMLY